MSGNGNGNGHVKSGADARIEHLDDEIRRLERETSTWGNPLKQTRLQACRRMRQAIERARLQMGWSMLGTDGSHI